MRKIFYMIVLLVIVICLTIYNYITISSDLPSQKVISEVLQYHKNGDYNDNLIIVNYGKPSCEERFYIYNTKKEKIIYSGLCAHGNGGKSTSSKPDFSNKIGSNCSSLGYFLISGKGNMKYHNRECFRLTGLSETNNNAQVRGLLIHPSVLVASIPFEIKGINLPLTNASQGCFSVSYHTMRKINEIYNNKPILIYAYI